MSDKPNREKTIAATYSEIYRYEQNGDYDRSLKASNRIIHMAPLETTAFHCKIVCLIQLSKFDEALAFINKHASIVSDLYFEKAYCQYRLNQPHEALKTISAADELDFRLKELKAQVLYRLEDYEQAYHVYQEMVKNADDDYDNERETNLGAVLVNLDKSKRASLELRDDTYELCFNKTCLLIEERNFVEAEKKLKQCEKLCRESFEEDGTPEDEIELELALIRIQLGYVYQRQGRIKEAQQLYTAALKLRLDDIALAAVASNNIVVINKDQNVFDSKKKIKTATNEALVHKLPSLQRKYIALNNAIFNYYNNQTDQCNKLCSSLSENWPDLTSYSKVLAALNLSKTDKVKEAIDLLDKCNTSNEEEKMLLQMCSVHFLLAQGDKQQACSKLEKLNEIYHKPGIVGALITLYLGMGKEDEALKVFEKTVDWFKKNKVAEGDLSSLWRQAAEFHIRNGHPNVAANSLEELLRTNPKDKKALAQLVLACSQFDRAKAVKLGKELVPLNELAKDVDMDSLESANWLATKRNINPKPDSPGSHTADSVEKKRKHKKRKGKLPKNYDSSITPDPERWLPKYERTGFRKKRDRRAKDIIKGSQGTASGQADQYDFSKVVEQDTPESQSVEPSPMARHQQRKGAGQKKKNKRR